MYVPYEYQKINVEVGTHYPNTVKQRNNATFDFWVRSLFQRACSALDLTVPPEWEGKPKDYLKYCLLKYGYVVVTDDVKHGMIFQPCSLAGYDLYFQPTHVLTHHPAFQKDLLLGRDGELLKFTPDYTGVWDIIEHFAEKLANMDPAIDISIINNKYAFFLFTKTKAAAEAFKKAFDKINKGEPGVYLDKNIMNDPNDKEEPWQFLSRDAMGTQYMTDKQLTDMMTILNMFDAEIGIPTVPYQKKERMVTSEADSRQIDSTARITEFKEAFDGSVKEIKKLYPNIQLSLSLRYSAECEQTGETGEDKEESRNDR